MSWFGSHSWTPGSGIVREPVAKAAIPSMRARNLNEIWVTSHILHPRLLSTSTLPGTSRSCRNTQIIPPSWRSHPERTVRGCDARIDAAQQFALIKPCKSSAGPSDLTDRALCVPSLRAGPTPQPLTVVPYRTLALTLVTGPGYQTQPSGIL